MGNSVSACMSGGSQGGAKGAMAPPLSPKGPPSRCQKYGEGHNKGSVSIMKYKKAKHANKTLPLGPLWALSLVVKGSETLSLGPSGPSPLGSQGPFGPETLPLGPLWALPIGCKRALQA